MELRQLEAFVAVAEERNFTRAAGRLHLAQSGLSATIRSLERELRARLFVRTTRHVGLTPAGEALLIEARQTLASARAAVEAVAAVEGLQKGTLTLGTMQASSFVDLAGFLSRFHESYPGVSLKLQQASASDLGQMLRDHVVDLIFTLESDQPAPEILSLPMVRSRVVVACRSDHVLADEAAVELRVLVDHPLVSFPLGWGVRTLTDQALRSIGAEPHYAFEVNDTSTVLDLVQAGFGVALVPEVIAALRPELHQVALKGARRAWTIAAQALAPAPPNPAGRAAWSLLQSLDQDRLDSKAEA